MLTLTADACTIVKTIISETEAPETAGLRFDDGSSEGADLAIEVVEHPVEGDTIVDQDGARVYLAQAISERVSTLMLDATADANGLVDFSIGTAAPTPPAAAAGAAHGARRGADAGARRSGPGAGAGRAGASGGAGAGSAGTPEEEARRYGQPVGMSEVRRTGKRRTNASGGANGAGSPGSPNSPS